MRRGPILILSLLMFLFFLPTMRSNHIEAKAPNGYPVHNLDTELNYTTIQEAIDANETLDGHTILVDAGTYYENIVVYKSLSLIGEDRETTIIDADFDPGPVVFINASNINMTGFTVRNSNTQAYGIYLQNSLSSCISENIITESNRGIYITNCAKTVVLNNTLTDNLGTSIYIGNSVNVTLRNNKLLGNAYNFGVLGKSLSQFAHDIDMSNTIDGKPIYYFVNQSNKIVPTNAGYVGAVNCVNITVKDMTLSNNRQSILFAFTKNSIIQTATVSNNFGGIMLFHSSYNTIFNNKITSNRDFGISLSSYSKNNSVFNNSIITNKSVVFNETADGIRLESNAEANNIVSNTISNNTNNIRIALSEGNHIYHNNFINSTLREYNDGMSINDWDNGYPSGGNYWDDYNGTDRSGDGIGDAQYLIDSNNIDHYPLMGMFSSFNTSYGYAADFVSNSSISNFSFDLSPIEVYPPEAILAFNVSGETGTEGFLRVCIPKILINSSYVIRFDNEMITNTTYPQVRELPCSNETYEYLYINYTHSEHTIIITGTTIIPEFPSILILPLLMIATLLAVIVYKRKKPTLNAT